MKKVPLNEGSKIHRHNGLIMTPHVWKTMDSRKRLGTPIYFGTHFSGNLISLNSWSFYIHTHIYIYIHIHIYQDAQKHSHMYVVYCNTCTPENLFVKSLTALGKQTFTNAYACNIRKRTHWTVQIAFRGRSIQNNFQRGLKAPYHLRVAKQLKTYNQGYSTWSSSLICSPCS